MTDLNSATKRQQWVIVGGMFFLLLAVAAAAYYYIDQARAPGSPVGKPVQVLSPSELADERTQWRQKEGSRIRTLEDALAKSESQRDADKRTFDARLAKAEEAMRANDHAAPRDPPAPRGTPAIEETGLLSRPLPERRNAASSTQATPAAPRGAPEAPASTTDNPAASPPSPPKRTYALVAAPTSTSAPGSSNTVKTATGSSASQDQIYIPAWSNVHVRSLSGVLAPAHPQSSTTPHPIFFHVERRAELPNGAQVDLTGCRIGGTTWGDLPSERALVRLESMSCVPLDGGPVEEVAIKGHVMGDDGIHGLPGTVVTKQGQLIANSIYSALLSGVGRSFALSHSTQTDSIFGSTTSVNGGQAFAAGFGQGVGTGFQQISQYFLSTANKLYPTIEVGSAIEADVVFTKGVTLRARVGADTLAALPSSSTKKDTSNDD